MSRPRNPVPSYLSHSSGRARVAWTDAAGARRFRMLPGAYNSPESLAAYRTLLAELEAAPHQAAAPAGTTVNEVLVAYLDHADRYYRGPDGVPTDEARHVRTVSRVVRELYGHALAAEFGPLALKAVRQRFVARGWCRTTVNRQADRVRQIFKWAVAEELVPPAVYQALAAVAGLRKDRTTARETAPVAPVADAAVDATLPHLNRHVRGLVTFQRLTGCRPGEAMAVRRADLDERGPTWVYRPARHKNAHRGKGRAVYVGPEAQALLRQFFTADPADYLFSPARAVAEVRAARAAGRKTPRYPSHQARNAGKRVAAPKRRPAARYTRFSYLTAVTRGCDRAFPPEGELARRPGESAAKWKARLTPEQWAAVAAWRRAHRWHPYQLRHTFATAVRKGHGLEAAQVLLGHARADVTQVYAERNEALAAAVITKLG